MMTTPFALTADLPVVPRRRGMGSHEPPSHRGVTDDWLTPPELVRALGPFDLDPCASLKQRWATADRHYLPPRNGLTLPWEGRVWLNPPYSAARLWMAELALHGNGVALIFARTDTSTWHDFVWRRADGIFFFRGRLSFLAGDEDRAPMRGRAGAPSCLVAYGAENADRLFAFDGEYRQKWPGHYVDLRRRPC